MDGNFTSSESDEFFEEYLVLENLNLTSPGKLTFRPDERIVYRSIRIVLILLMTFSVLTNGIVLHIFLSKKYGVLTTAKLVYANISLSDEIFLVGCVFYNFENYYTTNAATYLTQISGYVSGYSLALLAFKRYRTIQNPFQNRPSVISLQSTNYSFSNGLGTTNGNILRIQWKLIASLAGIWGLSILFSLILTNFGDFRDVIDYQDYTDSFFANCCYLISSRIDAASRKPIFVILSFSVIPLSIGFWYSVRTIRFIRGWNPPGETLPVQIELYRRLKRKSTIMITLVIFALLCWTPIFLFYTYEGLQIKSRKQCDYNYNLYSGLLVLLMLGVTINPIIYWYLDPDFRNGLRKLWYNLRGSCFVGILEKIFCFCKNENSTSNGGAGFNGGGPGRERNFTGLSGSSGVSINITTKFEELEQDNETTIV